MKGMQQLGVVGLECLALRGHCAHANVTYRSLSSFTHLLKCTLDKVSGRRRRARLVTICSWVRLPETPDMSEQCRASRQAGLQVVC